MLVIWVNLIERFPDLMRSEFRYNGRKRDQHHAPAILYTARKNNHTVILK